MEREGCKILHCFASECCLCVWQEIFLLDWELFDQRPLFSSQNQDQGRGSSVLIRTQCCLISTVGHITIELFFSSGTSLLIYIYIYMDFVDL